MEKDEVIAVSVSDMGSEKEDLRSCSVSARRRQDNSISGSRGSEKDRRLSESSKAVLRGSGEGERTGVEEKD